MLISLFQKNLKKLYYSLLVTKSISNFKVQETVLKKKLNIQKLVKLICGFT